VHRAVDHDLLGARDAQDLHASFIGTNGHAPVERAIDVEHRNLDAEHVLQAVDDADVHPGGTPRAQRVTSQCRDRLVQLRIPYS